MDTSSNTFFANFANSTLRSLNLPFPKMHKGISGAVPVESLSINYLSGLTDAANNTSCLEGIGPKSNPPVSSMSSYSTDSSRSSSPTPSESSSFVSPSSTQSGRGFRLVPCELQKADAMVLVKESADGSSYGKAFLLVGPAAQPYRQPSSRPTTRGSRVHPYKIIPSQSLRRRNHLCLSTLNPVEPQV